MKTYLKPTLKKLRLARNVLWEECKSLRNVIGCAIGLRQKNDVLTNQVCLIVYVTEKEIESELGINTVPHELIFGGQLFQTDIVELGEIRNQFGEQPYFCSDGISSGTISAMAKKDRQLYAVTCAHNLKGADFDFYSQDNIKLFDPMAKQWVVAGTSNFIQYSNGFGATGNYGFTDAGLIFVTDEYLIEKYRTAVDLPCAVKIRTGTKVSAMASQNRYLTGEVAHVEAQFNSFYSDICIKVDPPGAFAGDSGLLWRTNSNLAISIHAKGAGYYAGGGAIYSHGMIPHRIQQSLMVKFIM